MDWNGFESVTVNGREAAFKKFHQNDLKHWYRLFLRSSGLLNLDLHDRVAITMLDLCDDFGIEDARGTLLKASFSHKDIASIVGASRPRSLSIWVRWNVIITWFGKGVSSSSALPSRRSRRLRTQRAHLLMRPIIIWQSDDYPNTS